jgi:drug/metabolite transporter (DMT)-like permease
VTLVGQVFSLLLLAAALVVLGDPVPGGRDWMWGAIGGAGGFVGLGLLYFALARGSMTVVAPLTAVVSAVVPLASGIGFGERPSVIAYFGVAAALIGITLVTGAVGTPHTPTQPFIIVVSIVSGAGFGWMFTCLDRTTDESGMWPLLAARIASITLAVVVLVWRRPTGVSVRAIPALAFLAGLFDMGANLLFVAANREGMLSLVAVITALYPVSTIALAMRLDRERVTTSQAWGMACAGLALALVSLGR